MQSIPYREEQRRAPGHFDAGPMPRHELCQSQFNHLDTARGAEMIRRGEGAGHYALDYQRDGGYRESF